MLRTDARVIPMPTIAITEYPPVVVKHFHWESAGKSYVNVWHAWRLGGARVVYRISRRFWS